MDNVVSGFYRERNYDIIVVKNPDNNQIKILPYQEYFLPIYSGFSVSIP